MNPVGIVIGGIAGVVLAAYVCWNPPASSVMQSACGFDNKSGYPSPSQDPSVQLRTKLLWIGGGALLGGIILGGK